MENKKFRHIVTVIWGMCFCINLTICLWNPHPIAWIITGIMLGGIFIMLINNPLINKYDELIELLQKSNKRYAELFNKIFKKINEDKKGKKNKKGKKK